MEISASRDSRLAFLWMMLGAVAARTVAGLVTLRASYLGFALGQIGGVVLGCATVFSGGDLAAVIERALSRTAAKDHGGPARDTA